MIWPSSSSSGGAIPPHRIGFLIPVKFPSANDDGGEEGGEGGVLEEQGPADAAFSLEEIVLTGDEGIGAGTAYKPQALLTLQAARHVARPLGQVSFDGLVDESYPSDLTCVVVSYLLYLSTHIDYAIMALVYQTKKASTKVYCHIINIIFQSGRLMSTRSRGSFTSSSFLPHPSSSNPCFAFRNGWACSHPTSFEFFFTSNHTFSLFIIWTTTSSTRAFTHHYKKYPSKHGHTSRPRIITCTHLISRSTKRWR